MIHYFYVQILLFFVGSLSLPKWGEIPNSAISVIHDFFFASNLAKEKSNFIFFVHILILASTIKLDSIKCHQVLLSTTTKVA